MNWPVGATRLEPMVSDELQGYWKQAQERMDATNKDGNRQAVRSVRRVRDNGSAASASHGRRQDEQYTGELANIVHRLSHPMALEAWEETVEETIGLRRLWWACVQGGYVSKALPTLQEVWRSLSHEEMEWVVVCAGAGSPWGIEIPLPRVTEERTGRVARLRMLGNGQVPLCAATAFLMLGGWD